MAAGLCACKLCSQSLYQLVVVAILVQEHCQLGLQGLHLQNAWQGKLDGAAPLGHHVRAGRHRATALDHRCIAYNTLDMADTDSHAPVQHLRMPQQ